MYKKWILFLAIALVSGCEQGSSAPVSRADDLSESPIVRSAKCSISMGVPAGFAGQCARTFSCTFHFRADNTITVFDDSTEAKCEPFKMTWSYDCFTGLSSKSTNFNGSQALTESDCVDI